MTVLLIVLAFVVVAALVLALELLRPHASPADDLAGVSQSLAQGKDYQPMLRLFEERDFETAASLAGGRKRLAQSRGRAMRFYLRELRGDFLKAWAICRLLAPISQEADPVVRLFGNWLSFHCLFALVWARTFVGTTAGAASQAQSLVAAFSEMRQGVAMLLEQDSALVAAASRV